MQDGSDLLWIVLVCIIGMIYLAATIWLLVWVMQDAESRAKSGCLVVLLVLFLHIPGLLIWLLIRPEKKIGHRDQP